MSVVRSLRAAVGQSLNELRHALREGPRRLRHREAGPVSAAVEEIRNTGFTVLPQFLEPETCSKLIERIDDGLARYREFVQVSENGEDHRLFGLDVYDPQIRKVAFDPFAMGVLSQYQHSSTYEGFALCARLSATPGNKGSGQGWHRDSAAFKQVKLMVYLTDVGLDNGPFQYVAGSHQPLDIVRCTARYGYGTNQFRYTDEEIARRLDRESDRLRTCTAPAGTALMFDARGQHRGMPIVSGTRYAITTYLWFDMPAAPHVKAWTIESQQRNGPVRR